ncbi:MAG: hypothetical protein FJY66_03315 [Calditrichaeota bacterium]|nr:hypothetical protein [Calditrichota bacterium]
MRLILKTRESDPKFAELLSQFCQCIWDADSILRKYISEQEVYEVYSFAQKLAEKLGVADDAAKETIDLLSQATTILRNQEKQPRIVGFLSPVKSITALPGMESEGGFCLGPFKIFTCRDNHVVAFEAKYHQASCLESPMEDEFGHSLAEWWMAPEDLDDDLRLRLSLPYAFRECCKDRICFLAEVPKSPSTLWPGPVGLGGESDFFLFEQQVIERFENLVRYLDPDFAITLDGPGIDFDDATATAFVRVPAEPGKTLIEGRSKIEEFQKLLSLHKVLTLEPQTDFSRCLERAVFWVGSATKMESSSINYLKHMIALESVLTLPADSITESVSTRVAHVLEEEFGQIEYFKKRIRRLYDVRSRIVHEGEWYVSTPDIEELRKITRKLIDTLLCDPEKWNSKQELAKWVEVKDWVTTERKDTYTPPERIRQWIAAFEEARQQREGHP